MSTLFKLSPALALLLSFLPIIFAGCAHVSSAPSISPRAEWIEKSDTLAVEFFTELGALYPELGSEMGLSTFDPQGLLLNLESEAREQAFFERWHSRLGTELSRATDLELQADIEILRDWVRLQIENYQSALKRGEVELLPGARLIFQGLQMLVNPTTPAERRRSAVSRFKVYVYGDKAHRPLLEAMQDFTAQALARTKEKKATALPARQDIEAYLQEAEDYTRAIRELLSNSGRTDWSYEWVIFQNQLRNYHSFLRQTLLPQARSTDYLSEEAYQKILANLGVDGAPAVLAAKAKHDFDQLLPEFHALARSLGQKRNLKSKKPAAVVEILNSMGPRSAQANEALYQATAVRIEKIIVAQNLLSLPSIPLRLRLASPQDSQGMGVPFLRPPSLLNRQEERGELLIPDTSSQNLFADFLSPYVVASMLAHEGRPGHEIQFAKFMEKGVSLIRNRYAATTVNVEGWANYAEDLVQPYLTEEERFMAMRLRLWRVARAFLEPEYVLGRRSRKEVEALLQKDLGFSSAFIAFELERYKRLETGLAPAYYQGYKAIVDMRAEVDQTIRANGGTSLAIHCFNERLLEQGLLPIRLLRQRLKADVPLNANCK